MNIFVEMFNEKLEVMKKNEVCVYIANEAQLEEARELLNNHGEKENDLYTDSFDYNNGVYPFLRCLHDNTWILSFAAFDRKPITLLELEEILKSQR